MTRLLPCRTGIAGLAGVLLLSTIGNAQQKAQSAPQKNLSYDVSRETVLEGNVVQYTPASSAAPLGPHVTVQTSSGVIDVHLGRARRLGANHFSLASGDRARV